MAAVINDNVINKVVGRTKKEKEKPKDAGDQFHSVNPDQMRQMLSNLNDLRVFMRGFDVSESVFAMRNRIDAIEGTLLNQLKQIEDPESQDISDAELLRQILDQQRNNQMTSGQTWINTDLSSITPTINIQPYGAGGGSGSSGDIMWRTMDTTTTIPPFTSGSEEITDFGGFLPKDDDE